MLYSSMNYEILQPGNLLVDAQGYVKLCDFGLVKFLPLGARTCTVLGTLAYLPPEMVIRIQCIFAR